MEDQNSLVRRQRPPGQPLIYDVKNCGYINTKILGATIYKGKKWVSAEIVFSQESPL